MRNTIRSQGKPKGSSRSQKLAGDVQLARIRLARAESELKSSEEHLRVARRRRKEAKQAARRAKRNFKLARTNVSDATQFLAEARSRLLKAGERAAETPKPARRAVRRRRGNETQLSSAKKQQVKVRASSRRPLRAKKKLVTKAAAPVRKAVRSRPVRRKRGDETPFLPAGKKTVGSNSRRLLRSKPAARTASSVSVVGDENQKPIQVPRDSEVTPETVAPVAASETAPAGTKPQPPHI
jgi:hypothetical protein